MKPLPGLEFVMNLLEYYPETGLLIWKRRAATMFTATSRTAEHQCNLWNAQFAGKIAGCGDGQGYQKVSIFGQLILSHRVAYAIHHNEWPDRTLEIDHINGRRSDNRIANLRIVNDTGTARNKRRHKNNTSGCSGVSWLARIKRWQVRICIEGKDTYIGVFADFAEAKRARINAEILHGYHPNHGRAA